MLKISSDKHLGGYLYKLSLLEASPTRWLSSFSFSSRNKQLRLGILHCRDTYDSSPVFLFTPTRLHIFHALEKKKLLIRNRAKNTSLIINAFLPDPQTKQMITGRQSFTLVIPRAQQKEAKIYPSVVNQARVTRKPSHGRLAKHNSKQATSCLATPPAIHLTSTRFKYTCIFFREVIFISTKFQNRELLPFTDKSKIVEEVLKLEENCVVGIYALQD